MTGNNAAVHVIDDDLAIRDAMQTLFRSVCMLCHCHASAESFLDTTDLQQPGCILLDLCMPGMNGLELQTELCKRNCRMPVIFLSGNGGVNEAFDAMQNGATDFLSKPVDDEVLISKVRAALKME